MQLYSNYSNDFPSSFCVKCVKSCSFWCRNMYFKKIWNSICNYFTNTAEGTAILPNFLVWKFCEKAQILHRATPETMRKLCLSIKIPHQEIRCNYGILRSIASSIVVKCTFLQPATVTCRWFTQGPLVFNTFFICHF